MNRGQRLKELREAKRLSQTEAARHIGVSKQTLYKYENNIITNIPSDIVERIATLYETTPAFIMGWESAHDRLVEAYIKNDRLNQYSPEQISRALDFLDLLQGADADAQALVENFLKSRRSDL